MLIIKKGHILLPVLKDIQGYKDGPGRLGTGEMSRDASGKAQSKQSHSGYMRVRDYDSNMVRWNLV